MLGGRNRKASFAGEQHSSKDHLALDNFVGDLNHHLMNQVSNFRAISWTEGLLGPANKGGQVKVFSFFQTIQPICPRAGKSGVAVV